MSLRQIKRLLQQSSELANVHTQEPELTQEKNKLIRSNSSSSSARQKKAKQAQTPVDKQQVIRHQVNSLLQLDRSMASKDSKVNLTVTRIRDNHNKQRHIENCTAKKTLGNTRSSSTELKSASIPTFNKKRYKKHQEEKKLARIAKLLKKGSAASKTPKQTKKSI